MAALFLRISGPSANRDVGFGANILVAPAPAFTIRLEHDPQQIVLDAIIDHHLRHAFAVRRANGDGWVELKDHDFSSGKSFS